MVNRIQLPPITINTNTQGVDVLGNKITTFTPLWYETFKNLSDLVVGTAGGDLSGSYPNPVVAQINGVPLGTTTATSGNILIADGTQWTSETMSGDATIASTGALTLANTAVTAGTYKVNGSNIFTVDAKGRLTSASNITVTAAPSGSAGGDLSGSYPSPTVAKINGVTLGTTTATSGNILIGSGTSWITQPMSGDATITSAGVVTIASNVVTYAKFQQVAGVSLVGNPTGSTATAQGITLGASLGFSGTTLQRAALTGDVTASANSNATTIANNAVTYAKFNQVAASSLVGNPTGSLANAQGITLGVSLSFSGTTLQREALTGDVTASANSNSTTIANSAVTYAKIQNVTDAKLLGNNSGGAAAPSEIGIDSSLAFSTTTLQRAALTGDVTALAGSNSTTIANNAVTTAKINNSAVTFAKIQNISNAVLLGNNSGGAAAPQEITLGTNLSFSGTTLNAAGGSGGTSSFLRTFALMGC